jgi:hypothetical protein
MVAWAEIIVVMEGKHQHRTSITLLDMDRGVLQEGRVALEIVDRVVLLEQHRYLNLLKPPQLEMLLQQPLFLLWKEWHHLRPSVELVWLLLRMLLLPCLREPIITTCQLVGMLLWQLMTPEVYHLHHRVKLMDLI